MTLAEFEAIAAALCERFKLPDDERLPTSTFSFAIEAAIGAVERGGPDPFTVALKAIELLPSCNSGAYFVRGLTFGLALALASEAQVELRSGDGEGVVLPAALRVVT